MKKKMWNILVYFSSAALAILSVSHANEHKGQLFCHLFNMGAKSRVATEYHRLQVSEDKVLWKVSDPRIVKCWI